MSENPGTDTARARDGSPWLARAPLIAAALLICLINGFNLDRLVRAGAPRDPWEATEVLEGWRSLLKMPVYESSETGHSTHVYGALVPWAQGEIFRWVGPNNVSGRVLTLLSALGAVALLASTMRGERSAWYLVVAVALVLGINHRSGGYFAENRPDMTAMLFSALGVLLLGRGLESRRWWLVVPGSACLVLGFFFKQTAAIFAAVPLCALVLRWRRPTRSEVLFAAVPLAVSGGVIVGLKIFSPTVYYYMIEVPSAFGLQWPGAIRNAWELLVDSPLFLVLLGEWIVADGGSLRKDPRVLWVVAVLAVTVPFSAISSAKAGGTSNSNLPALLPLMAFCVLRLPRLFKYLEATTARLPARVLFGAFLALLVLMTAFPRITRKNNLIVAASTRDDAYGKVVALAAKLPGTVISPEDPTIALYAKRHAGRNIYSEFDTHLEAGGWPETPPRAVLTEIRAADYVVDVCNYWQDLLRDDLLRSLGFEPVPAASIDPEYYRIWRRTASATASSEIDPPNPRVLTAGSGTGAVAR